MQRIRLPGGSDDRCFRIALQDEDESATLGGHEEKLIRQVLVVACLLVLPLVRGAVAEEKLKVFVARKIITMDLAVARGDCGGRARGYHRIGRLSGVLVAVAGEISPSN